MSTSITTDDDLPECAVCSARTFTRCSGCPDSNVFFCSREHQKLLWPAHKHLCGASLDACYFPPLTEKECQALLTSDDTETSPSSGVRSLLDKLQKEALWDGQLAPLLEQLTQKESPIAEPRRSRILALCLKQVYHSQPETDEVPQVWHWLSLVHTLFSDLSAELKKQEALASLSPPPIDLSDPQLDPFRRLNHIYRQALTVSALITHISTERRRGNYFPLSRQFLLLSFSRLNHLIHDDKGFPFIQAEYLTRGLSNLLGGAMGLTPSR
ncbi:hypothetical protein JCM6882_003098 [Rhodosporidiobolus microsporus]